MRIAIFSDLHDNLDAFYALLDDAARQQVDRFVYLGDVGRDLRLFNELYKRQIPCTFGNWEVSGLRHMPETVRHWVADWPSIIVEKQAIYCHATPDMPAAATTTATTITHMQSGVGWTALFPRLHTNDDARWQALAAIEQRDVQVAFHGHTHVQQVWVWESAADGIRHLRSFAGPAEFTLEAGSEQTPNRYLVGVGSIGEPLDGIRGRYVIFDDSTSRIALRILGKSA